MFLYKMQQLFAFFLGKIEAFAKKIQGKQVFCDISQKKYGFKDRLKRSLLSLWVIFMLWRGYFCIFMWKWLGIIFFVKGKALEKMAERKTCKE